MSELGYWRPRQAAADDIADVLARILRDVADETAWVEDALCAQTDPEAFYPEKGGSSREAKSVCMACPVRRPCLEYALAHDERFGIWGGTSERQRRRMKRRLVEGAAA